jgi:EpsI family protein
MKRRGAAWAPVAVLGVGCLLSLGVSAQRTPELREPLATALPDSIGNLVGADARVSADVAQVAGFTSYAFRVYQGDTLQVDSTGQSGYPTAASIYLGYYDHQVRGHTIHSPKNCLPGSGWEALSSGPQRLAVGADTVTVNRYVLENHGTRALVLYWYQGRGRVAYNEYRVKWDLLRDAILKRRTDEALARIVVPIEGSEEAALSLARKIAVRLVPALYRALPS